MSIILNKNAMKRTIGSISEMPERYTITDVNFVYLYPVTLSFSLHTTDQPDENVEVPFERAQAEIADTTLTPFLVEDSENINDFFSWNEETNSLEISMGFSNGMYEARDSGNVQWWSLSLYNQATGTIENRIPVWSIQGSVGEENSGADITLKTTNIAQFSQVDLGDAKVIINISPEFNKPV